MKHHMSVNHGDVNNTLPTPQIVLSWVWNDNDDVKHNNEPLAGGYNVEGLDASLVTCTINLKSETCQSSIPEEWSQWRTDLNFIEKWKYPEKVTITGTKVLFRSLLCTATNYWWKI